MEIFGIIGIILIIIAIILFIKVSKDKNNIKQINYDVENHNKALENHNNILLQQEKDINNNINDKTVILNNITQTIEDNLKNQKQLSANAFEQYCDLLDAEYVKRVQEHDKLCQNLNIAYEKAQLSHLAELTKIQEELELIKKTRAATIAAQIKEKEIKEKLTFYCLSTKESELSDIKTLEKVKGQLNNPRILSMLIWQTYWQKPMTALCNNVLGTSIVCGIYKITNQVTDECYIGQAVNYRPMKNFS